jgi:hypothetical protein
MQEAAELVAEQHVGMLGLEGAADQHMVDWPERMRAAAVSMRRDARAFLAHEGARRAGHLVHDGDVAGEQVGKLREEERRAQFGGQLLVEQHVAVVARRRGFEDLGVDVASSRSPPPAATTMSIDAQSASSVLSPASSSARPGAIGAEPLPGFHLALVAALGDLQVPVDLGSGCTE